MGNATSKDYSRSIPVGASSKKTYWGGPGLPAPPGRPILISGTNETQPDVVAIRWERSPSNGGSAIVGYLVEHRRLGSPHWVRSTSGLCAFPELTLSGLEPGWRYQFRVRAQNAIGLSQPSEVSEPLTVTLQKAVIACAPHFDLELKDTIALENEQAEFTVQFSGTPLPKISWFKDDFEIFSSRRTKIITDNGKSILLIHQTALNDEGEIKCTATNRAGHIATRAKLILEAPPRIRLPRQYEDGLLFEKDETIRLKVSLAGKPTPVVTWYHDGELISKDARHVFEAMDGESILKILDAKRSDRGEYTVKVANKLGEDTASFLVTVTDRPAAPGKISVEMTLGRSVTLSWKEPEDDGGCKIGTYIVEYYRIGWEVWLKATTSRRTSATLTELIEGSEYKFRVKGENPYGVSDPSEESDIIFIPDTKRRIVTPSLNEKSQSHREISRSRGDKREVSFTMPAQRTRSLTREEGKTRDEENNSRFGYDERSASIQRLAMPIPTLDRPSRADSRVTFALDNLTNEQPPIPPARSRDHSTKQQTGNYRNELNIATNIGDTEGKATTSKTAIMPASTSVVEDNPVSRSVAKERSPSPFCMPRIQQQKENNYTTASYGFLLPSNSILKKQTAAVNEFVLLPPDSSQQRILQEDDENVLHGSSEFMLILYPEDETREDDTIDEENPAEFDAKSGISSKQNVIELMEDESDLIPPPMSLSLPELFSTQHQVVEIMREAVSSTELLHERAMERFYRAVAAEEASEVAKQKMQLEKQTKLAKLDVESAQKSSLRRRLSNSGITTQNLIASWQAKKNRRRSSEGQADTGLKTLKLLSPALLLDVEARSDPNLPSEIVMTSPWESDNKVESLERLRKWHETNVPLLEEVQQERLIQTNDKEKAMILPSVTVNKFESQLSEIKMDEAEEERNYSVETSEESSEEISSADSEDLKLLKSRILARQIIDEEDTYHPRGRPIPHVEPKLPQFPDNKSSIFEVSSSPAVRTATPVSPNNTMLKSILKKPKEELVSQNNFDKSTPPEKPIRKTLPQSYQPEGIEKISTDTNDRISNLPSMSEALKTSTMSQSDTDSIISAAEVAKNRRMQSKRRSMTPEEEAAEIEARMAVVNQYTEIVREHASHSRHGSAASSRRSSISEDQDQKQRLQEKLVSKLTDKQEQNEMLKLQVRNTNKVDKQKKNNEMSSLRKEAVDSRDTTPARDTMIVKDKRGSRPSSRDQTPVAKRNEKLGGTSSRSSSKTRNRTPSQERNNQLLTKNDLNEQKPHKSRVPSRPSSRSRSSSRERFGPAMPVKSKVEKLQKALESSQYRTKRKETETTKENVRKSSSDRTNGKQLDLEAKKTVRSTVSYITDLALLIAAMYIYFFKKETLAVPFIVLLLYRKVQEEIHGWIPRRWRRSTKKH
ncbi:hypothetical protein PUN28_019518 [Cardiocondyla obscurior]|uniref:Titin n=1 Tax=Cardiocondyla obscurior TaxID=286306 RepID=A0AAW2EAX4_9HYME